MSPEDLPRYTDLILPAIRAVEALGGSAKAREIVDQVIDTLPNSEELLTVQYPNRPVSVLVDRAEWGRFSAKLIGALEQPARGTYLLTPYGRELLAKPVDEATTEAQVLNADLRRSAKRSRGERADAKTEPTAPTDDGVPTDLLEAQDTDATTEQWREQLLRRLHSLTPGGFEDFVMYLLREFGLELKRVGGSNDEGIDGIGTAPLSPVLSSRVAVQVKRYDPEGRSIGREVVALFQRDAQTKGAERAILVTLGRFSEPAKRAALATTPTVDLIDGVRLADLILQVGVGVTLAPVVDERWFDRFE